MATCKNRAWEAARSVLISEQKIVGSNPTHPNHSASAQASDLSPTGSVPRHSEQVHTTLAGGVAGRSATP
jgi:hypothetical protein